MRLIAYRAVLDGLPGVCIPLSTISSPKAVPSSPSLLGQCSDPRAHTGVWTVAISTISPPRSTATTAVSSTDAFVAAEHKLYTACATACTKCAKCEFLSWSLSSAGVQMVPQLRSTCAACVRAQRLLDSAGGVKALRSQQMARLLPLLCTANEQNLHSPPGAERNPAAAPGAKPKVT
eukprot:CAMPEP_0181189852 /NCGR_PEP_ID=MMETSP1096-20121128/11884_1 /TAXON_ID=156174 ORGANISM="Chrysochromulina ericina, Strain CCMP281" /NCGR_SAMPLE_ID=MMETSP1096 /ASSEMBLY_ACC=CAM_ASM_000453 /LENGTH=176 /DNA_ID=CAMNT_0023279035 /DNA_START=97 /DNA_END=626 /DNA_ORIENTATION=-